MKLTEHALWPAAHPLADPILLEELHHDLMLQVWPSTLAPDKVQNATSVGRQNSPVLKSCQNKEVYQKVHLNVLAAKLAFDSCTEEHSGYRWMKAKGVMRSKQCQACLRHFDTCIFGIVMNALQLILRIAWLVADWIVDEGIGHTSGE